MFVNSKQFFKQLDNYEDNLERAVERIIRKVTKYLFNQITARTPVNTGYARRNWRFTVYKPTTNPLPRPRANRYDPPRPLLLTKIKFGDTITIYNNTPYIEYLENGSSQQAPSGMVAISMLEAEAMLQREFRKL